MNTTEMKNADVLNNVYIGCDEDGDIHLFKCWPTFSTTWGCWYGDYVNNSNIENVLKKKECIKLTEFVDRAMNKNKFAIFSNLTDVNDTINEMKKLKVFLIHCDDEGEIYFFVSTDPKNRKYVGCASMLPFFDHMTAGQELTLSQFIDRFNKKENMTDHPKHYTVGGIEVFDIYVAKFTPEQVLGIILGNATKYLLRGNHKSDFWEDMQKVANYVNWGLELHRKGYFK